MRTDFERQLSAALSAPMSETQRTTLDARMAIVLDRHRELGRRRPPGRLLLLAAAIALIVPVAALAGVLSSESPGGLAGVDEFQAELDAAMAEVPIPAGQSWPDWSALDAGSDPGPAAPGESPGAPMFSRGGGRSTIEFVAICLWLDEWLAARQAQDAPREQAAVTVLSDVPTWPSWDSPFWDQSLTDLLKTVIDSVASDDEAPAQRFVTLNCAGS